MTTLTLFVMRHAEAAMLAASDVLRDLTEQGKAQATAQGNFLKSTALCWDAVLVSPYQRALQTFDQINRIYHGELTDKVDIWQAITPYGSAQLVEDYLQVLMEQGKSNVLLISHLPLVGEIVKHLTGQHFARFYPATIVKIQWNGQLGEVDSVQNVSNLVTN